jgi:hypothetical protein
MISKAFGKMMMLGANVGSWVCEARWLILLYRWVGRARVRWILRPCGCMGVMDTGIDSCLGNSDIGCCCCCCCQDGVKTKALGDG